MSTCPEEITSGGTRYTHEARGNLDVYVAEGKRGALDEGENTWRYCVDKSRDKVYFYCAKLDKTVWILPDIFALPPSATDGEKGADSSGTTAAAEQPAMKVRGVTERSSSRQSRVSASPTASLTNRVGGTTPVGGGSTAASSARSTPIKSYDDTRKSLEDELRRKMQERMGKLKGTTTPTSSFTPPAASASSTPAETATATAPSAAATSQPVAATKPTVEPTPAPTTASEPKETVPEISIKQPTEVIVETKPEPAEEKKEATVTPTVKHVEASEQSSASSPKPGTTLSAEAPKDPEPAKEEPTRGRSRGLSIKERLALHRQRSANGGRRTPETRSGSATPVDASIATPNTSITAEIMNPAGVTVDAAATTATPSGKPPVASASSSARASAAPSPTQQPSEPVLTSQQVEENRAAEEKKAAEYESEVDRVNKLLEEQTQTRKEREDASRRDQVLAEQAKRLSEANRLQELTKNKIEAEQRKMEQRRLALDVALHPGHNASPPSSLSKQQSQLGASVTSETSTTFDAAPKYAELLAAAETALQNCNNVADTLTAQVMEAAYAQGADTSTSTLHGSPLLDSSPSTVFGGIEESRPNQTITYSKKFIFEGQTRPHPKTKAPIKHGAGTYFYNTDRTSFYEGEWRDDKKHGQGVMNLANSLCEGTWQKNNLHGQAVVQSQTLKGSIHFANGVPNGTAMVEMQGGETFTGKMRDGKVGGTGAIMLTTDDKVEWKWNDGSCSGTGVAVVHFANGDVYTGALHRFALNGKGTYKFFETDAEYSGPFVNGLMEGTAGCVLRFANGNVYEGGMKGGAFHGVGTYTVPSKGFVYDGDWRGGKMHGRGTLEFENGDVWRGIFEKDRRTSGKYVMSTEFELDLK